MIWTIHDELNNLLQQKVEVDFKRQVHDMVLMGYLRDAVVNQVWPQGQNFADTAPFVRILITGYLKANYRVQDSMYQKRDITEVMLEKDVLIVCGKPTPIWKYRDAFVHVACDADWKWVSSEVLNQLVNEEWEKFENDRTALEARARYFNQHGRLR